MVVSRDLPARNLRMKLNRAVSQLMRHRINEIHLLFNPKHEILIDPLFERIAKKTRIFVDIIAKVDIDDGPSRDPRTNRLCRKRNNVGPPEGCHDRGS